MGKTCEHQGLETEVVLFEVSQKVVVLPVCNNPHFAGMANKARNLDGREIYVCPPDCVAGKTDCSGSPAKVNL